MIFRHTKETVSIFYKYIIYYPYHKNNKLYILLLHYIVSVIKILYYIKSIIIYPLLPIVSQSTMTSISNFKTKNILQEQNRF